MRLSNKAYDILKWVVMVFLPALGVLYSALAKIWGFPYGAEIAGTIAAVTAFLGTILQISNAKYKTYLAEQAVKELKNQIPPGGVT